MINLFYNHYTSSSLSRQKELNQCFDISINNPFIDRVYVIGESPLADFQYSGVPTFADICNCISQVTHKGDVNIFHNSDCYLSPDAKTMDPIRNIPDGEAWCLSRWDISNGEATHYNERSSQDCWIFKGPPRLGMNLGFKVGQPGCDNRMAYEMHCVGYRLRNPSLSIILYHLHESDSREHFGGGEDREIYRVRCTGRDGYVFVYASEL